MSGPLETSIRLEDVFAVVTAKRVPLAPELAGYLTLEVAEGADAAGGEIDPRFVFIGEEGSVALVRPRREGPIDGAEASVRAILGRLLDASGSHTASLTAVARRRAGVGIPALVDELEAALIPVNRAAGRRALARLAREVRRVTLGVGRNASQPSLHDRVVASERTGPLRPPFVPGPPPSSSGFTPPPPSSSYNLSNGPDSYSEAVRSPLSSATFGAQEEPTTTRSAIPSEVMSKASPDPRLQRPMSLHDLPTRAFEPPSVPVPRNSLDDIDDLLAGLEAPPPSEPAPSRRPRTGPPPLPPEQRLQRPNTETDVAALLAMSEPSEPVLPPSESSRSIGTRAPRPDPFSGDHAVSVPPRVNPTPIRRPQLSDRQLPTAPSLRRTASATNEARKRSHTAFAVVVGLVVLALGAAAVFYIKPGVLSGRTAEKVEQERVAAEAERARINAANAAAACKATLDVVDVPAHAEVLLRVGQAPVDVERMPMGARLEFVATAEGYAAKRAVVPAGAAWEKGPDGKPRFEVAAQLDRPKGRASTDLWPAGEPGSEVGGNGPAGTVHVVSTPKGAEVWLLAGVGPQAKIDQLKCDVDVDVLVAGPTTFRKRLHVKANEFVRQEADPHGARMARVSAGGTSGTSGTK